MTLLYTLLLVIRPLCQARGNDVSCPGLGKRWGTRTVQTRQTTHPHSRSPLTAARRGIETGSAPSQHRCDSLSDSATWRRQPGACGPRARALKPPPAPFASWRSMCRASRCPNQVSPTTVLHSPAADADDSTTCPAPSPRSTADTTTTTTHDMSLSSAALISTGRDLL